MVGYFWLLTYCGGGACQASDDAKKKGGGTNNDHAAAQPAHPHKPSKNQTHQHLSEATIWQPIAVGSLFI